MSNSSLHTITVRDQPERAVTPVHLLVLLSLCLGAIAWGEALILGSGGLQLQSYLALLGFYGAASGVFVLSRIRKGKLQLFEIPVFMTCMFFLQFGLVPLRNFIDPTQLDRHLSANGEELVQALSYCILGMIGFWIGCEVARRKQASETSPGLSKEDSVPASREAGIMLSIIALYAVGVVTKFYLLRSHLFSYVGSSEKLAENLASMQVLNVIAQCGTFALVAVCIERYRNQSRPVWKVLFWGILFSEVLWGAISGMKGAIFQNFIIVALVSSIIQRRLNLRWLVVPFFALVLLYPVSEAYRSLVNERREEVTSFAGAGRLGQTALQDATQRSASAGGLWYSGLERTLRRFDLLTSVADILVLGPRASYVKGNVQWWMLPIYPFVPRLLWPSKPVGDEGGRLTLALGGVSSSATAWGVYSTAVTYPGDLYLQFGWLGVPIGMFVLGLVAQLLTNRLSGRIERQDLFVYACVFLFGFPVEDGVFDLWATLIKLVTILYVLSWVMYGPRSRRKQRAETGN
jgi:hypothetical protein